MSIPAHAQTVANPSFEATATLDQPSTLGAWRYGGIANWTVTGQGGLWQPATSEYATLPDGKQVAWSNGGTISQDLGQAPQLNTTYTLTVAVGHRADATQADTYTISLYPGCSKSGDYSTIPAGTFQDVSLVCTPTTQTSGNLIVTLSTPGPQIDFDNVRLAVKSVAPKLITTKIDTSLFWCTACDNSAGDNVPMTGNLVIQQQGTTSSWTINTDGTVSIDLAINVAVDPADFLFYLTDTNGVAQPGQLEFKIPQATIQSNAGFILGTLSLPGIKFLKTTDASGKPLVVFKGWTAL